MADKAMDLYTYLLDIQVVVSPFAEKLKIHIEIFGGSQKNCTIHHDGRFIKYLARG
jgi:hypothetical protein